MNENLIVIAGQPYDIDPFILENAEIPARKRGVEDCFIGQGSPILFDFKSGQPPAGWTLPHSHTYKVVPQDGKLQVTLKNILDGAKDGRSFPFISRPFSVINGSVSIAFNLKINNFTEGCGCTFLFDSGDNNQHNILEFRSRPQSSGGSHYFTKKSPLDSSSTLLGPSAIQPGQVYRIVIIVGMGGMKVWENDNLAFSYTGYTPNEVEFGVGMGYSIDAAREGRPDISIEIGTIKVIIGPSGKILAKRNVRLDDSAKNFIIGKKEIFKPILNSCKTAATPLTDLLKGVSISAWDIFWGKQPSQEILNSVNALKNNQSIRDLVAQVKLMPRQASGLSLYVGIGMSFSYVVTGSWNLGFYIDLKGDSPGYFVFMPSAGFVTNAGVQAFIEVGLEYTKPKDQLGWGYYVQADLGTFFSLGMGITNTIPITPDPGFYFALNAGYSVLPGDAGAGVGYTFNIHRI